MFVIPTDTVEVCITIGSVTDICYCDKVIFVRVLKRITHTFVMYIKRVYVMRMHPTTQ